MAFEQPSKVAAEIGSKIIEQQVYVERGEMVSIVESCGASAHYVPPIKVKNSKRSERADFHGVR